MRKLYDSGLALGIGKSTLLRSGICIETHEEVAAKMFNVPVADVTPEQRAYAKRMRFYALYSTPVKKKTITTELLNMNYSEIENRVLTYVTEQQ